MGRSLPGDGRGEVSVEITVRREGRILEAPNPRSLSRFLEIEEPSLKRNA